MANGSIGIGTIDNLPIARDGQTSASILNVRDRPAADLDRV
jgi:hypothetical protein